VNAQPTDIARRNQLLNGLTEQELSELANDLELRTLRVRDPIVRRHEVIADIYFPVSCVLSTVAEGAANQTVEVATIGNEGMAGLPVFLGADSTSTLDTFVQVAGEALWMRARAFRSQLQRIGSLTQLLGRYTQALLTQISQASACNRMHPTQERCARWLLMTHDRVLRDEFELTHEFLAQMLGVRRATVGDVAAELQAAGVIRYSRGTLTILDRAALQERACECYRIIRDEYERLLPGVQRTRNPTRS